MIRKIAILLILIFILQLIPVLTATAYEPFRNLIARSAILAEKDTGTILFESNASTRHPVDAFAKIMTLLLAAQAVENDDISDNELITMVDAAWEDLDENSPTQEIYPGEQMTFIDLMYSSFVGNASEASNMIALRLGRSMNGFVTMMNNKAAELGAFNTRFTNPNGQHSEFSYTTAYDQLIIFSYAMNSSLFAEVSSTFRHITESIDAYESRTLTNSNYLINPNSRLYYRSSVSGCESASYEGGHSLIAYSEENGLNLISIVLGSDVQIFDDGSAELRNFTETLRLFQWGYENFAWRDVLKTTDLLQRVPVMHGAGADFVNARPEEALTLLLNNSIPNDAFEKEITIFSEQNDDPLIAPISAGDILGEVVVTRNGVEYARIDLVANTDIDLNGVEYMRRQITEMFATDLARNIIFILVLLIVLYLALVIRYNIVRANRLRRIKNAKSDIVRDRHQNFRD